QKLSPDSIASITKENYKTLISPSGIIAKETILKDPFGLSFIALKKLRQLSFGDDFILKDGFLLSSDEQNILLFINPTFEPNDTAVNEPFVNVLYALQENLSHSFQNKVQAEYFGATLVAVANARQIKKDIQFTVGIALTLLLLILIFFYRKLTLPLILFTPTLIGGLLAVAILYLIRTKVAAISLGIGSVLLGVTLDYSLHILTHIRNGNSIDRLYKDIAPAILMSSLTTASAFLCLLFLQSQALQDLGIFAAISVLGASVFALLFIPQVYSPSDRKNQYKTFLDRFASHEFHKNKLGLALISALLLISTFTYTKVVFEKDIGKLNYEPQDLIAARQRLDALTNIESQSLYLTTYGDHLENVLAANDKLNESLETLKKENKIIDYSGVGGLVHSQKTQTKKIAFWKQFWNPQKISSVKGNLIHSGNELGFKPDSFDAFYELLNSEFKSLSIKDFKSLNTIPIEDYINSGDGFTTINSLIKLDSTQTEVVGKTFKNAPNTILIDRQGVNETFLGNLKNDFNRLIGYSILAVLLILLLYYRSFSLCLVTALPIFLTWFITVGIMGLLNIHFNIFNIIICTFIFGLGIDYSIFMTNGLLAELKTGERSIPTHRTSIILSVITTILGVGVLIFAKHPALHSISAVSLIGILSAVTIAFSLQPLLFKLFIGSNKKRPISLRVLIHSALSTAYYALGGIVFSLISTVLIKVIPISKKVKMDWYHRAVSKFLRSVLYSNPFVKKKVLNPLNETFEKPAMIIANHASALDSLTIGMLHPKIIFLVNDWVYNSLVFRFAARLAEFYPVSQGIENSLPHLQKKIGQGYSLMAFPEGTRSDTNKIKRWHKGAFYLAEQLKLDILPVLIHGNSEVQPRGSAVIRDGSITVKILDRIPSSDTTFGKTDRQRTRSIGAHFRREFEKFRDEIENASYFQKAVLEEFRYKGNDIYKAVDQDFKKNRSIYKKVIDSVGNQANIVHLAQDLGQLDILLSMDSVDRKIHSYYPEKETRKRIANSFTAQYRSRISVYNSVEEAMGQKTDTFILNLDTFDFENLTSNISDEIVILILLKQNTGRGAKILVQLGFKMTNQEKNCAIWQR
ncbi:MAG: MMPL family transporter, partial [Aurantibacter sp.]